jgi:hypothetical protein
LLVETVVLVVNLIVNLWLLIILHRQNIRKQLPWFVSYILWEVLSGSLELVAWLFGSQLYNALYWWMETIEIALIVAATCESFLRIFKGFTSKLGFRLSVWTVLGAVVVYSAWKAIHAPPLHGTKLAAFEVGAEFLFRWGVAGIALLTTILSVLMKEPITREDAVVTGFGVACLTFAMYVSGFSLFGTSYAFLTKYVPSVGYFVAAFWWIYVFSRPVRQFGFEELGMGPDEIAKAFRRYREFGERL